MNAQLLALALSTLPETTLSPPPPPPPVHAQPVATAAEPPPAGPPPAPPPHVTLRGQDADLDAERPPFAALSFSPLTTFMLGVVLEGEFRVHEHLTTYLAGEFYGAWMGWGAQAGLRWYPSQAFRGFFVDGHARASDLFLVHAVGGGLELGSQHQLGRSRWSFLWSMGLDLGAGAWRQSERAPTDLGSWLSDGLVAVPKLRLMLGYTF
ncbi:MAG: hypothetical protein AB1730_08105 [Myxococcota bacterium]